MVKGKKQTVTWINAKKEHPTFNDLYLVCTKHGLPREGRYDTFTKEFRTRWGDTLAQVIWWMPLPLKPIVN